MEYFTRTAVARLLDTHPSSLVWHEQAGRIPPMTHTKPGRRGRYYSAGDVETIRRFWNERLPRGVSEWTAADVDGMRAMYRAGFTQAEIGAAFDCTQADVSRLLIGVTPPGSRGGLTGRRRREAGLVPARTVAPRQRNTRSADTSGAVMTDVAEVTG